MALSRQSQNGFKEITSGMGEVGNKFIEESDQIDSSSNKGKVYTKLNIIDGYRQESGFKSFFFNQKEERGLLDTSSDIQIDSRVFLDKKPSNL